MLIYAIPMLVAFVLILLTTGILLASRSERKPIDRMMNQAKNPEILSPERESLKHTRWSSKVSQFLFQKRTVNAKSDANRTFLAQADVEMTSEEFLLIRLLFTAAFGFIGFSIWHNVFAALVSAVSVWFIPYFILKSRIQSKRKKFDNQLQDAIGVLSNSLKAGYSFFQALSSVVEETPDPLSKEFKIMLKEMSFGLSVDQSFNSLLLRISTEDLQLLTTCVLIQRDIGGNLSELLDNISVTIRERQKLNGELKALTAQGKLSGMVVVGLPFVLALAMYFINREYIMLLFTTKIGIGMLIFSGFSQAIGIFAIGKIIKVEV